jgi:hypothetical protein
MNCFEIRNEFVSFWRKTMPLERRVRFAAHLRDCPGCDHAFRLFAMSAPVLHSSSEPEGSLEAAPGVHPQSQTKSERSKVPAHVKRVDARHWSNAFAAFAMAAAAGIALYFAAVPPKVTFEDVITEDYSSPEPASYSSAQSFFGQELLGRDAGIQDTSFQSEAPGTRDDFAG